MPTIHAAGYSVPTAATVETPPTAGNQYQDIRAPLGAFGGFTAEALSNLSRSAETAAGHFERINEFHDAVAVDEQTNAYEDAINKVLYGDPNVPDDVGYMGLQGRNAVERRADVRAAIDEQLRTQRGGMQNARQLYMFDRATRAHRNSALAAVGRHYDDQYNKYAADTAIAGAKNALDRSGTAAASGDMAAWNNELTTATTKLAQAERLRGSSDEVIKQKVSELTKGMAENWFNTTLERDPIAARTFLEHNKELFGDKYDNMALKSHEAARAQTQREIAEDAARKAEGLPPLNRQRRDYRVGMPGSGTPGDGAGIPIGAPGNPGSIAMTHSYAVQEGVAKTIATTDGLQHWAGFYPGTTRPFSPKVRAAFQDAGLPLSGPVTEAQWETAKPIILKYESGGGQNIPNYAFSTAAGGSTAGGPFQIVNSTWRNFGGPEPVTAGTPAPAAAPATPGQPAIQAKVPPSQMGGGGTITAVPPPGDTGAVPLPSAPGPQAAATGTEVWGDSLGMGINSRLQTPGQSRGGLPPAEILANIKKQPEDHWKGKTVVLSSGSNSNQMPIVEDTINYLKDRGANVIAVGYGPKFPDKNAKLTEIAGRLGVPVIPAQDVDPKEGVHPGPGGYDKMVAAIKAQAPSPQAANTVTTPMTPAVRAYTADAPMRAAAYGNEAAGGAAAVVQGATPAAPPAPVPAAAEPDASGEAGTYGGGDVEGSGGGLPPQPPVPGAPVPTTAPAAGGPTGAPDRLYTTPRGTPLPIVPYGEGQATDAEVPGLPRALEEAAKMMPEDPRGDLWPGVVNELRRKYNLAYQAQSQAERLRKIAQGEADRKGEEAYVQRMFDPTKAPTEQEIALDKSMSLEARKRTIDLQRSLAKPDPRPDVDKSNELEIIRRMGLPDDDPNKISNESQITAEAVNKNITADTMRRLKQDFRYQSETRSADISKEYTRIVTGARTIINPMRSIPGTDPTGGNAAREEAYANHVNEALRAAKDDPKQLRKLLDASPDNKEFLGRPELVQQYSATGSIGKPIMDIYAGVAAQQPKPLPPINNVKDLQAAQKAGSFGAPDSPEALAKAIEYGRAKGLIAPAAPVNPGAPLAR